MAHDRLYYAWVRSARQCDKRGDRVGALRAYLKATHSCALSEFSMEAVERCCRQLGQDALKAFFSDVLRDPEASEGAKSVARRRLLEIAAQPYLKPAEARGHHPSVAAHVPEALLRHAAATAARLRESGKPRHGLAVALAACLKRPDPRSSLREYTVAVAALTDISQHEYAIALLEELLPCYPADSYLRGAALRAYFEMYADCGDDSPKRSAGDTVMQHTRHRRAEVSDARIRRLERLLRAASTLVNGLDWKVVE